MKVLREKKGTTMVEVIVAFAVLTLCIAMTTVSLQLASGIQKRAVDRREAIHELEAAVYGGTASAASGGQWIWTADSVHFRGFTVRLDIDTLSDGEGYGINVVSGIS